MNDMKENVSEKLNRLMRALSALRISAVGSEYELHEQIAAALKGGGFVVMHEEGIAPRCRIDFLSDGIGIEVKRGKVQRAKLLEQCRRYLASERVEALIVVLDTSVNLPAVIAGKPVRVFGLNRLWGIALP